MNDPTASGSMPAHRGIGLSNTIQSEVAPCFPLPSLPVFCGAVDQELRLFDELSGAPGVSLSRSLDRREILAQSSRIAELLCETDVSYLNLRDEGCHFHNDHAQPPELYSQVLLCNPLAFEYFIPDPVKDQASGDAGFEKKLSKPSVPVSQFERDFSVTHSQQEAPSSSLRNPKVKKKGTDDLISSVQPIAAELQGFLVKEQVSGDDEFLRNPSEPSTPNISQVQRDFGGAHVQQEASASSLRKSKNKKKGIDNLHSSVEPVAADLQDATIRKFCELLEDLCSKAEIPTDDHEETEWLSLPVSDVNVIVNEITSIRSKKLLHLIPVDILVKLLRVLDHQIHRAEGLSVGECEYSDSDVFRLVFCALESIHASLTVMAHDNMPKQLYKEEMIERILEFSRHQVVDVMSAFDPSYRAVYKPSENGPLEGNEDDELDASVGSASKKRRSVKGAKVKKSTFNRVSGAMSSIFQKLCTILGLLRDLLLIERLSDSCILQLLRTSFTTFLVDNIQLLQLKSIGLISGIFYSYTQHRTYIIEEVIQIFWKLPFSKRALRAYCLPDEEQRQIQMVTALFIHLVHGSANLPEPLRWESTGNLLPEVLVDSNYANKCNEAVIDTCCNFWSRVLQRLTSVKTQDASEVKMMMENLITDLLTTLNLPEYPASAPILEVLCVLLLQNAGLKSKDISARSMAIDLLGTIATRLKHDAVLCRREKYWVLQELVNEESEGQSYPKDACSICMDGKVNKALYKCESCQRLFHADCMGIREHGVPNHSWYCQFCLCERQLLFLQSYCKSQCKDNESRNRKQLDNSESSVQIKKVEVAQQMVLNYLQDASSTDDAHLFVRWFYLCLWYKENPKSQHKFQFYLARLKSKAIVRDPGAISSPLMRDSVKRITLTLGQNNSFSRGFDKILHMLLASLMENSPVIRAKALRAVSIIVEADPEVLGDKRVQLAVEGRFCDSAISVREAALELVGRHIASHPEVGVKYFEKVAERIKDTGVSVRKRAIKIIRDICTSNTNFSGFTNACIEIISRVNDDESSIQDLVCKTFNEFWFEESSGFQTQYSGDGSSVPLGVAKKAEQIVEMLRRMLNHQLLVTVIKRNLVLDFFPQAAKAAGINPVALAAVRRRCELMCKCLLERILQVEEMNSAEGDVPTLPYVLALHAFCIVDPSLCMPNSDPAKFLITLQPYLKSQVDNRVVAQLLESIIYIIDSVVSLMQKFPASIVEELVQDLKQMIVRHSFLTVVHACIKCVCSVSKKAGSGAAVVENLIQLFFKRLDVQMTENKQQVGRSLFCLGLLIRYGYSLFSASSNKNIDIASSINLFIKYLSVEDLSIKVRSLQALGYVLIATPDYMLERDIETILETTLSQGCNVRLKMQVLQNLYEYLLDAESQLGMDNPGSDVAFDSVGGSSVPVAAGAGDTNICGGIVQLYWDKILGRCLDVDEQVRQSALKIVEIVLRQGLVHPITCVPYLIALETDPLEVNQNLAHHLLMNMNEKYPAFFESRLGDGLQLSFIFMQSTFRNFPNSLNNAKVSGNSKGKPDDSSFNQARLGVSRIYKLIRANRVSRNKFMSSIVRKFDNPSFNDSVVPFLTYCTEILALLPFTSPDEPLYLIYAINRIVQVRTGAIEANMKALCQQLTQRDSKKINHENGTVQEVPAQPTFNFMNRVDLNGSILEEPAAQHAVYHTMPIDLNGTSQQDLYHQPIPLHNPAKANVHGLSSFESCITDDDKDKIQVECLNSTALQLLLKLKRHLKIVYSLNDARCQAYSPTEPLRHGEALSRQNIPFDISDITLTLPSTYQDLVQRYQAFKNALREDTLDYSIYTANIKRKRPPARRGRPGRGAGGDDEDDDDEDYWGGGRRVSGSGRRGNSSRGRQR